MFNRKTRLGGTTPWEMWMRQIFGRTNPTERRDMMPVRLSGGGEDVDFGALSALLKYLESEGFYPDEFMASLEKTGRGQYNKSDYFVKPLKYANIEGKTRK